MAEAPQRWHAQAMRRPTLLPLPPLTDLAHMSWTRRDGAPSDITALAQSTEGYLWIGSRLGLFRFDGLQFQHYPFNATDPVLSSSDISALAADQHGGLWIGYRLGGITHLQDHTSTNYGKQSGLVGESTEQLVVRKDGSVWATADGRLMHLEGVQWIDYAAQHGLQSVGLYSLFFDRDGALWTAYKEHIFRLFAGKTNFEEVVVPNHVASQFIQMHDGAMWFSDAFHSVTPIDPARRYQGVKVPGVPVLAVAPDGSLWAAHDSHSISRIRLSPNGASKSEDFNTANGLTDSQTRALLVDRQGSVWVGTARGLDRFLPTPLDRFTQIALDYYPALLADPSGGIWLNDMDKPLMKLSQGRLSFVGEPHGSSSLMQDSHNRVVLYDQITRQFFRYSSEGGAPEHIETPEEARQVENWCLGQDPSGALLACFEGHGLWRYDGRWTHVTAPELPLESPFSLVNGIAGRVWLGYAANRVVLEEGTAFHAFGPRDGLALNTALTFYDAPDLTLVGGSDGLAFLSNNSFHSMQTRTPGLLRGISGIVRDTWDDLWLNAASGLIRLPAAEWKAAVHDPAHAMDYDLLQEKDGLLGAPAQSKPSPSAVVDTAGRLWFATSGHLVAIDPAAARKHQTPPSVLLQSVLVNDTPVTLSGDSPLRVPAGSLRALEINYIGLDLQAPDRVMYEYRLDGQDTAWQSAGARRQVFYTNLPPGKYTVRVRAGNGGGLWNELVVPLSLEITPAFYQTWWFYAFCVLALAASLWWLYQVRIRMLTSTIRDRAEERALERARIARDLHDTLLQGIQGLVLRFHFAAEQLPLDQPVRAELLNALDQADDVVREGRERITDLRKTRDNSPGLVHHLTLLARRLEAQNPLRVQIHVPGTAQRLQPATEDELLLIGREALTNVVRHSGANCAEIEVIFHRRFLTMTCRDNGRGFQGDEWSQGNTVDHWGLPGMKERARRLGSSLHVDSAPDRGVTIRVDIPGHSAYALKRDSTGSERAI